MLHSLLTLIIKVIEFVISKITRLDDNMLVFIPHGGCMMDGYGLNNYKSDNALAFLRYIVDNRNEPYKIRLAVDNSELERNNALAKKLFPEKDIECFPYYGLPLRPWTFFYYNILIAWRFLSRAKYIFASEQVDWSYKSKKQTIVFLGYFIPFKNDYNIGLSFHDKSVAKSCDYYITTSLLSSQIISHTYGIPLWKFRAFGFSRNDNLLIPDSNAINLRINISKTVKYHVDHIFLYTPTHRDYERNVDNVTRGIFGVGIDSNKLAKFLESTHSIIVCKLHSAQVRNVINKTLPQGVVLYQGTGQYGLCELMQISDCLITDYTSAYFDFLLFDKPVIFNFYDFEKYKHYRGFSFDPLESILAGDIYKDAESFIQCMKKVTDGIDEWQTKRKFVKELVHKYRDSNSSKRIFEYIFNRC